MPAFTSLDANNCGFPIISQQIGSEWCNLTGLEVHKNRTKAHRKDCSSHRNAQPSEWTLENSWWVSSLALGLGSVEGTHEGIDHHDGQPRNLPPENWAYFHAVVEVKRNPAEHSLEKNGNALVTERLKMQEAWFRVDIGHSSMHAT